MPQQNIVVGSVSNNATMEGQLRMNICTNNCDILHPITKYACIFSLKVIM